MKGQALFRRRVTICPSSGPNPNLKTTNPNPKMS